MTDVVVGTRTFEMNVVMTEHRGRYTFVELHRTFSSVEHLLRVASFTSSDLHSIARGVQGRERYERLQGGPSQQTVPGGIILSVGDELIYDEEALESQWYRDLNPPPRYRFEVDSLDYHSPLDIGIAIFELARQHEAIAMGVGVPGVGALAYGLNPLVRLVADARERWADADARVRERHAEADANVARSRAEQAKADLEGTLYGIAREQLIEAKLSGPVLVPTVLSVTEEADRIAREIDMPQVVEALRSIDRIETQDTA